MKPLVSVVIGCRNEFPQILGTIYSIHEELEHFGYPHEFVVVDNLSTDSMAEILEDRMRRWVRCGLLRVLKYEERGANVLVRNIGSQKARGEVLVICDAHVSIKVGTLDLMIHGHLERGGLWHSAINIWGDTTDIRCYGYDLKLEEKFWGNLCRRIPDAAFRENGNGKEPEPYRVPMASHCLLVAGRKEYLELRGYNEKFQVYGGGEPYLDLKYWLLGKEVWIEPRGLVRHAFGLKAGWRRARGAKRMDHPVWVRGKGLTQDLEEGDETLHYSRGYSWTNELLHGNFLLSSYTIGGYPWLQRIYKRYWETRKANQRYLDDLKDLRRWALSVGAEDRTWISKRQKLTLDELLAAPPWLQ
jgi:glycosyltransferase involved in cell wall biosynthesis